MPMPCVSRWAICMRPVRRPDDAKSAYQALAVRSPKSPDGVKARIRIAVIESTADNDAAAMKVVDDLLVDIPDEPTALLLRAGSQTEQRQDRRCHRRSASGDSQGTGERHGHAVAGPGTQQQE